MPPAHWHVRPCPRLCCPPALPIAPHRWQVKWVYRAVNFLTDLFFGVDKDLDHLPSKRKSVQPTMKTGSGQQRETQ